MKKEIDMKRAFLKEEREESIFSYFLIPLDTLNL